VLIICVIVVAINCNVGQLQAKSVSLGRCVPRTVSSSVSLLLLARQLALPSRGCALPRRSTTTQKKLAAKGSAPLVGGGKVITSLATQGDSVCVSPHKTDVATAQCQSFCNAKFKKFHCNWCKCRGTLPGIRTNRGCWIHLL
jgi:hypothetical protein